MVTYLRHFSLQGDGVEYNVVIDNNFQQEISFHNDDDGNNLIENNYVTLPPDMPPVTASPRPNYFAIMGPWSTKHRNSAKPNFLYCNKCLERNHNGNPRPWSDVDLLYKGPREVKPANPATNFPSRPVPQVRPRVGAPCITQMRVVGIGRMIPGEMAVRVLENVSDQVREESIPAHLHLPIQVLLPQTLVLKRCPRSGKKALCEVTMAVT